MDLTIILILVALVVVAIMGWFSARIDADYASQRCRQWCCRISCLLLLIPIGVIILVALFIFRHVPGDPLIAFKHCLSFGSKLWIASSIAGILLAVGTSFPMKRSGEAIWSRIRAGCNSSVVAILPAFMCLARSQFAICRPSRLDFAASGGRRPVSLKNRA